ncbi:DNA-binding response regulator, LytR/AlgR family [Algoriella xinjiangensis]|uniref:DNA-binding response regulator, LytR/AlgR family n=1 Tax=Algoriella xinjiangensis TaxID=684065 RepID=A0A1I4SGE8_9FLAO|nr:LytTR family DNA-binding domain-containing protein [Algoriella xinjiangensis]SFM63391.1 DNA-binding response regulator, LytR/AlgR family [Algoriella xinjiangensis]VDH16047.1 Probable transcriptional regulatory protein YehT [Algoriella xinjiangensis]
MIRAIAIDDEPLALMVIENYCARNSHIDLVKTFSNLKDAQKYINQFPIDLMFLDIQISRINGMDFYKNLEKKIPVIFTTAFAEYALDGFNVSALDYLLKPIEYERFEEAINKAVLILVDKKLAEDSDYLTIRADYKLNKILYDDILFIEGLDDYVKIHLIDNKKITARISMKSILEKLPEKLFIRVHRSFIVPLKKIKSIQNKVLYLNNQEIPIGDTYKNSVSDMFKD